MLLGVDVSVYQGSRKHGVPIDWRTVASAGIRFAICKATEGLTVNDESFLDNIENAFNHGLDVGAYHFFRPHKDPQAQAEHFFKACEGRPLLLPPSCDIEVSSELADVIDPTLEFLLACEKLFGRMPLVYSYPWFIKTYIDGKPGAAELSEWPLWIAHYNSKPGEPMRTPPWATFAVHQYTAKGRVPGIATDVDCDAFRGSLDEFRALGFPDLPKVPATMHIQDVLPADETDVEE